MLKPPTGVWKGKVDPVLYKASCQENVCWNEDIVRHIFISELGGCECLALCPSDFFLGSHCVVSVWCVVEKNLLPLPGISLIPWLSGPEPIHYVKILSKKCI